MEYKDKIRELVSIAATPGKLQRQITIDYFEEFDSDIMYRDEQEDGLYPIERDHIGAWQYNFDVLKEAMNPVYDFDIQMLSDIYNELQKWYDDIDWRNQALGIPRERG